MPQTTTTPDVLPAEWDLPSAQDAEQQLQGASLAVAGLVGRAQQITVATESDAAHASALLVELKKIRSANEKERKSLVGPLNQVVKDLNARFKEVDGPLEQADAAIRGKLVAFEREQAAARAAEQARLEAEAEERRKAEEAARLEAEAKARAEQEAAEQRARAQQEAAAAAAREAEARNAAIAQTARNTSTDRLREIVTGAVPQPPEVVDVCRSVLAAREAEEAAQAAAAEAAAAQQAAEAAAHAPLAVAETPQVAEPVGPRRTSGGTVSTRMVWKHEIVDAAQVPREFLVVDERLIREAVRAGRRDIPGVRIFEDAELAVSAR